MVQLFKKKIPKDTSSILYRLVVMDQWAEVHMTGNVCPDSIPRPEGVGVLFVRTQRGGSRGQAMSAAGSG